MVASRTIAAAVLLVSAFVWRARKLRQRNPSNENGSSSSTPPAAANPAKSATTLYVRPKMTTPEEVLKAKRNSIPQAVKPKHAIVVDAIPKQELQAVFDHGVLRCYSEMQLPSYSRYEKWTQSCYMEIDDKWTPRPAINVPLYESLKDVQEKCRLVFAQWYADLYSLDSVEVTTLNSFVTKYVPEQGKNEFGKHIDGVKVQGSLVLCLPTDEPNDWPGMLVWDGPKERGPLGKDPRPEHQYVMQPGDALLLDRMVWHHGLPITKGHRYVVVNFYAVNWKKVANAQGL